MCLVCTHRHEVESGRENGQRVRNEHFFVKHWQMVPGGQGTYESQTILRTLQKAFHNRWFWEALGLLDM